MKIKSSIFIVVVFLVIIILNICLVSQPASSFNFFDLFSIKQAKVIYGNITICVDVAKPILDPIGNLNAPVGYLFTYDVNATSPSDRTIYYYDNATFFNISESTGLINFTPLLEDSGSYLIKISAKHNICKSTEDYENVNFTILGNHPPVWNESKTYEFNLTEDEKFYLNVSEYVTDAENDPIIFYSNISGSEFPSFNLTTIGIINFTPIDQDVGFHSFSIFANDSYSNVSHAFNFTVININDAPVLDPIPTPQYACEDSQYYYDANASDNDTLIPNSTEEIYFYNNPTSLFVINENTGEIIFTPDYDVVGNNTNTIFVSDEEDYDSQNVVFKIIPVNDAPILSPIGSRTVKVNKTLSFNATANDEEDGTNSDENLIFNITWSEGEDLFDIDNKTGWINYTGQTDDIGTYNILICVTDDGIDQPTNSSFCEDDYFVKSDCENISLTVLDFNHPPEIISYYPLELELTIYEGETIEFNITAYDPDGTTLTNYWYVNYELTNFSYGNDSYHSFVTESGDAGDYSILAVSSDGEDDDSIQWNVTVLVPTIPAPPEAPLEVGAGGGAACQEKWRCTVWGECQNISILRTRLTEQQYEIWKEQCYGFIEERGIEFWQCGIQMRICEDVSKCGTFINEPSKAMTCIFMPPPSCSDGIRNCHHGACEILVDCGGPCNPCPIRIEKPKRAPCGDSVCELNEIFTCLRDCYLFWILWIIATMMIIFTIIVLIKRRKEKGAKKKRKKILKKEEK